MKGIRKEIPYSLQIMIKIVWQKSAGLKSDAKQNELVEAI